MSAFLSGAASFAFVHELPPAEDCLQCSAGNGAQPMTRPPPPPALTSGGVRLSLLLIEDHEPSAIITAKLLRRRGHAVSVAGSCAEALALAAAGHYDCVVSDLGLPDGSGHDLMRTLQRLYGLRGIAVSAFDTADCIAKTFASGFSRHFVKPIDIGRVQQALSELSTCSE